MTIEAMDDSLLMGVTKSNPQVPEMAYEVTDNEPAMEFAEEVAESSWQETEQNVDESVDEQQENIEESSEVDEYGNQKVKRTYTEDEVNERINRAVRERMARMERNLSQKQEVPSPRDNTQVQKESEDDWQRQLESFVEETVSRMSTKQQQIHMQQEEARIQHEFEEKITNGMSRFADFSNVVGSLPITDAMTIAARGVSDPAAFLYAAAKRAPEDLSRISSIRDPYAQMVEMGKLEERLKKGKVTTKTPKPMSRMSEDSTISTKNKPQSLDDMLAASDAARLSRMYSGQQTMKKR